MTHYRLFFINTRSGHIERAEVVDAIDDLHAVEASQGLSGEQASELLRRARRVHCFDAKRADAAAPLFA